MTDLYSDLPVYVVGANHTTMDISCREILAAKVGSDYETIYNRLQISKGVLISTCNRLELVSTSLEDCRNFEDFIKEVLADRFKTKLIFEKKNSAAVRHLFRVVAALDSMVVGETQIVGQVKKSYQISASRNSVDKFLHHLFQFSFSLSKRIKSKTGLGGHGLSISYVAVQLANQIFQDLNQIKCLVIGSGQMAELVVLHLRSRGCKNFTIANRTLKKASELAQKFDARAVDLSEIELVLEDVDLIIGSISIDNPILTKESLLTRTNLKRGDLFLLDLGVPRNFSPRVAELPDVYLYDIDHLGEFINKNEALRNEAAKEAEVYVDFGLSQFEIWLKKLKFEPQQIRIREFIKEVCNVEIKKSLLKEGLELQSSALDQLVHRISQKISQRIIEQQSSTSGQLNRDQFGNLPQETLLNLYFDELLGL